MEGKQLNIVMYPWLAMGHIIPYYQLGIKFAEKGHNVTLLLPKKAKLKLPFSNLHPLLTLHTITIPHVHPLPLGTQVNFEIPFHLETHLATAMDLTRPEFESIFATIQPNLIFFDFGHWVPEVVASSRTMTRCVSYFPVSAVGLGFGMIPYRAPLKDTEEGEEEERFLSTHPPPGYPCSSTIVLKPHTIPQLYIPFGEGLTFYERITTSLKSCDAISIKTIREIEGKYCDFLSSQYNNKPILVPGLALPESKEEELLEARWAEWLARFDEGSVIFCGSGSQLVHEVDQFQELLLGFEMTNLPFFLALKPPTGCTTVEEAFPGGFVERVGERGVVTGDWVQQSQIVDHPSVGCFVNHGGSGSLWESLMSKNQIVLIPHFVDQILLTKIFAEELNVAVEVGRGEDGSWVSKESLCKAIKSVMDEDSEIGNLVKSNHKIWRQKLHEPGFLSGYMDNFIKDLQALVG